jgi:AcrR family transcriptional regulator
VAVAQEKARTGARSRSRSSRAAAVPSAKTTNARRTIMTVATQRFLEDGYSKTTMADLASASGASVGLLYYHFGSKEDLFFAIWSEYQDDQEARVRQVLKEARAQKVDDPVELLRISVRAYFEGAWDHRAQYWMVHARDLPPRLVDSRRRSGDRWKQRNAKALASDSQKLSRVMMATLVGFLTEVSLEVVKSSNDAEAEAIISDAMFLLDSLLTTFVRVRDDKRYKDGGDPPKTRARRTSGGGSSSR